MGGMYNVLYYRDRFVQNPNIRELVLKIFVRADVKMLNSMDLSKLLCQSNKEKKTPVVTILMVFSILYWEFPLY